MVTVFSKVLLIFLSTLTVLVILGTLGSFLASVWLGDVRWEVTGYFGVFVTILVGSCAAFSWLWVYENER